MVGCQCDDEAFIIPIQCICKTSTHGHYKIIKILNKNKI